MEAPILTSSGVLILKPLLLFSFVLMTLSLNWLAVFVPDLMRDGDLPFFCILKLRR